MLPVEPADILGDHLCLVIRDEGALDVVGTAARMVVLVVCYREHPSLAVDVVPGVEVYVRKLAPLGDPIEILLRGYTLTIRGADADKILVEEVRR